MAARVREVEKCVCLVLWMGGKLYHVGSADGFDSVWIPIS